MNEKIKAYGYQSWLQLYRDIERQGLASEDRISLTYNDSLPPASDEQKTAPALRNDLTLYVQEIKAEAFSELYNQLPGAAAIAVMVDMLEPEHKALAEFLTKLPTRP
jgi:hypothetical protein